MKLPGLRLAILVFALSAANLFGEETNKMVLRCHPIQMPHFSCDSHGTDTNSPFQTPHFSRDPHGADTNFVSEQNKDTRDALERMGVPFPAGSFVRFEERFGLLCMLNTDVNQEKLEELLELMIDRPALIELDASFIAFDHPDIEAQARKNLSAAPTMAQIAELWKAGKGRLLGTSKIITRSGVNAQSQGVDEQIYPKDFVAGTLTNGPDAKNADAKVPPTPTAFETREVGMIFNITPTVQPDGKTVELVLAPEISDGDAWDDLTSTLSRGDNKEENLTVRQPRVHSAKLTTTIAVKDGATFIQGGMASRDGQSLVYLFLTARIIGPDGQPIHPDAKPKLQEDGPKKK